MGVTFVDLAIKLLGTSLVFISFYMIGLQAAYRWEQRPKELRALITALEVLQTEVSYGLLRLPKALERSLDSVRSAPAPGTRHVLQATIDRLLSGIGTTAGEAWQESLREAVAAYAFTDRDQSLLAGLGEVMGTSNSDDQVRHIGSSLASLRRELETAEIEGAKIAKVSRSTWAAIGGCIALMLL
jgi:stage III sporulation protein AB